MKRRLALGLVLPLAVGMMAVAGAMHTPAHTNAAASTPPPPPTFVPTSIPPPPGPPTATPTITPIPTNTPVPTSTTAPPPPTATATSAPLGAPARIVASVSLRRQGKTAIVHWQMAYQLGIKGFRIYAGHTLLTRSLIHPHHSRSYTARVPWLQGNRYALLVLFKNGHAQRLSIR